jgi:hypothetical protein
MFLITAISAVSDDQRLIGYVNVAELLISLTLSTMYVLVKLIKYLVSLLCDSCRVLVDKEYYIQ